MQSFREALEAYGADYDETLRRFVGNEGFYLKILGKLPQDKSLQRLGSALENGNFTDAFEAAHTLKGVAGNLGLTPLYQAVCVIVEPLRLGEKRSDYQELYRTIELEFERAGALLGIGES